LKGHSEKELLETAAEMVIADREFNVVGRLLVPYIKEKWEDGFSSDTLKILNDKEYHPKLRMFVLDSMTPQKMKAKTMEKDQFKSTIKELMIKMKISFLG